MYNEQDFEESMQKYIQHYYKEVEKPILSKTKAGKEMFIGLFLFFLGLFFFPLLYVCSAFLLLVSREETLVHAIFATPFTILSLFWLETVQTPLFEMKRSFGFHKSPVYEWGPKRDVNSNIRTGEALFDNVLRKID